MSNSTTDYAIEKFLISDKPLMMLAMDILQILNKINKLTIKGIGELCPATVSVSNIITQNLLVGKTKTDKIILGSETLDDGRLISTIEIVIRKIENQ